MRLKNLIEGDWVGYGVDCIGCYVDSFFIL